MDDLGEALALDPDMRMMGGGNPAVIPEVTAVWRRRMHELLEAGEPFDRMLAHYDPPAGSPAFRDGLATFLSDRFGWPLTRDNIAITAGGQSAFFCLFNLLAGAMADGGRRQVLLPVSPEYIGYADQGVAADLFVSCRPEIERFEGERQFKYHIDFETVERRLDDGIAAVCVSRPTNPTGNVLTDAEVSRLSALCKERDKLLIIDNAYGLPFPGILYTGGTPVWDDHIVLTLSLSKLGLPGTRTGIVVARPEIARAVSAMTSVVGLANENIGQAIVRPLLESGEITSLCEGVVRPFYEEKSRFAQEVVSSAFGDGLPVWQHRSEGALFLWLWFEDLPLTSRELYLRLKERKVLVVPGEPFFYGLDAPWDHSRQCIRMTYSQDATTVEEGIHIIAEEIAKIY